MRSAKCMVSAGTVLQMLGLAVIVGGVLALGAFVAPELFRDIDRVQAGRVMSMVFNRFDKALLGGLVLILIGEMMRFLSGALAHKSIIAIGRYVTLAVLAVIMFYTVFVSTPDLLAMTRAGIRPGATPEGLEFTRKHKQSENLYKLQVLAGVLLIILTPFVPARDGAACLPDDKATPGNASGEPTA